MLVCWEWLSEYVDLNLEPEEMALRFAMSGLNHESTEQVGPDTVIDLEVTSNRGDCLGHIGVAREASVLLEQSLRLPDAAAKTDASTSADSVVKIDNAFLEGCPEYTARIIRGVKVGPSPEWLVRRLASIGIGTVNNVVDVTNYVLMECGQPLHAFDLTQIRGSKIVVRAAKDKEKFEAIDHRTYELDEQMVVIADSERAIALGGVMGGVDSEVTNETTDILIEAARFQPLAIRRAARKLKLHSPSSYRFERRPDPAGLEWASLRCCQLILQVAGGTLLNGAASGGEKPAVRETIAFRLNQIPRVLGIDIPQAEVVQILSALGCDVSEVNGAQTAQLSVLPPTWRGDLERECDLLEEVARIHGYEKIPENVAVPIGVAAPRPRDIVLERSRHVLSAFGVDEAMTPSVVTNRLESFGSFWSDSAPLAVDTPLLEGAKLLRRSIVPSLLACRHMNQTQSMRNAELYEIATAFVPGKQTGDLPAEQSTLGIVTGGDIRRIKAVVQQIIEEVAGHGSEVTWSSADCELFAAGAGLQAWLGEIPLGFLGLVSQEVRNTLSLDQPSAAAEINVDGLTTLLQPVRTAGPISSFPAIARDLNFVVDESVSWASLATLCRSNGGPHLNSVEYQETYRDAKKDGAGKKRTLLTLHFRSLERTLTGDEVDANVQQIVSACKKELDGNLLG